MTIGERIKISREKIGYSQVELSEKIGISKQSLYKYENNIITNIPSDKIELIADLLYIQPSYLMGWDDVDTTTTTKGVKIPVLGKVAAGIPIEAVEDIVDYEEITEAMARKGEYFGLMIQGDSMEPRFKSGDVVIVRKQNDAETGDIVIATVNGSDAVCKRLQKYSEGIALISSNPVYEPYRFTPEDISNKPVRILGKVVELRAKF